MSGNKTYVRKPLRRYERDFERPMEDQPEEPAAEGTVSADPDITAAVSTKYAGPPQMSATGKTTGKKPAGINSKKEETESNGGDRNKRSGNSFRGRSE